MIIGGIQYTYFYNLKKGYGSSGWYYEVWVSAQGKMQQIRSANVPYPTKGQALIEAKAHVQRIEHDEREREERRVLLATREEERNEP